MDLVVPQLLTLAAKTNYETMHTGLVALSIILGILLICSIAFTVYNLTYRNRQKTIPTVLLIAMYLVTVLVLAGTVFCLTQYIAAGNALNETIPTTTATPTTIPTTVPTEPSTEPTTEPTTEPPTEPPTEPDPTFVPENTPDTDPNVLLSRWDISANGTVVETFQREDAITFGDASEYSPIDGITTFRGDNYRSGATFGTTVVESETLSKLWTAPLSSFNGWSGAGWTGQPLVVRWDAETRAIMNIYQDKKDKEDLVEIIYATMDGHIRFFDLEDGEPTRDPINMGMNFKGSGSLDPRGYPLLYVGAGDFVPSLDYSGKAPRMYIVSLIDGSILYERSGADGFSLRGWYAFDGAPLVDAETDTLIWAAESGIIYTKKLNTQYDKSAGTISIDPQDVAKARYRSVTSRNSGFESSAIIVGEYLYAGDNGGTFMCVDLNTMQPVWVQDIRDDLNATPVYEWSEDGNGYLYLATSLEYSKGTAYIYKLNAATGEIVWEKRYDDVPYNKDVSGGALSSPLLGRPGTELEGMVIFSIARTPKYDEGILVALDTHTGEVIWERELSTYTWSTPTAVYTEDNRAYIILCDAAGNMHLINNATGETLDKINIGSNIEASPVVYKNTVIVGTRGQLVYAVTIE